MMRFICALLVLAITANAIPSKMKFPESYMRVRQMRNALKGKIVGGEIVEPYSIPFQVSFQTTGGFHFCGASLMDKDTVITAAHCCAGFSASGVQVVVGEHDLDSVSEDEQKVFVDKITYHESFDSYIINYDICLLKLSSSVELNDKVQPVALPEKDQKFSGDVVVSGWGTLFSGGPASPLLRSVTVEAHSEEECKKIYGNNIDETMICAGSPGKDSCQGDSGGPLAKDGTLVGIVSWGYGCDVPNYPGVYTKVSNFIDWIAKNQ